MGNKEYDGELEGGVATEKKVKTKRPRKYNVIMHNDDYTTMEFVVWVLKKVFHLSDAEATHCMLTVHHKGKGSVGEFTRDIAESKTQETLALAEAHGMPLMVTTEPVD